MHSYLDKLVTLAVVAFTLLVVGLATRGRDSSPRSYRNACIPVRRSTY